MIKSGVRIPLRPLGRVLAARERGENTDAIEQENTRHRNQEISNREYIKAKGRLVVLATVFSVYMEFWSFGWGIWRPPIRTRCRFSH